MRSQCQEGEGQGITNDETAAAPVSELRGERGHKASRLRHVYWLPLPVFAIAIAILANLRIEKLYSSSALFTTLNLLFLTLVSLTVSFLAARSFLAKQSTAVLFLGMGTLALALGAALAALKAGGPDANPVVSVYNASACLAGLCHLTGATLSLSTRPKRLRAGSPVALASYLVVALLALVLVLLVRSGTWPVHFVQGSGPTAFGLAILRVTIGLFALSAVIFAINYHRDRSSFRYWYGLGLGLIVVGLVGVSLQKNIGDPLNWAGRLSQYVGGVYILLSVLPAFRKRAARVLPLERALRESEGRYQSLVDLSPDAILVSVGGKYVFANQAAARLFGAREASEVVGRDITDLIHPDDRELVGQRVEQAFMGVLDLHMQVKVLRLDGSPVEVEAACARVEFDGKPAIQVVMRDLTEHKRAEERYRALFENMLDGFALHEFIHDERGDPADYRFLAVNPAFEGMTGLKAKDIVGRTVLEALPGTERHWIETYGRVVLTGEPVFFENYHAGLKKHFQVTAFRPAANQFACIFADITERKQAEEELRETNEYLDNLFNYANAPIIVWDPEFRITRFNRAFEVLTGRKVEAVLGESLEILFPAAQVVGSMELIRKTLTGERWETVEIPILNLDGSVRTVLWNSATLFARDGVTPVATIAQGQDITERKRAEEERLELERQLQQSQKLESLGVLAGGIAHDFNNILTGVLGNADLALASSPRPPLPGRTSWRSRPGLAPGGRSLPPDARLLRPGPLRH